MFKFLKLCGFTVAILAILKYIILYAVPHIENDAVSSDPLTDQKEAVSVQPYKDGEVVKLQRFKECIDSQKAASLSQYQDEATQLMSSFEAQLKHNISNDGDKDDFIDWMNGWANGYRLALNKGLDFIGYVIGRQDNLEELIKNKFDEIVIRPAISQYHEQLIIKQESIIRDYVVTCSTTAISEQYELAAQRESLDGYEFQWNENGAVMGILKATYDEAEEAKEFTRDQMDQMMGHPSTIQTNIRRLNQAHKGIKTLRSGRSLKQVMKIARAQAASKTQTSLTRTVGAGAGGIVGGVGVNLALKGLASKGLMGKTSALLFKASGSKIVSSMGLSSVTKMVSAKAASAAGGKMLFLVAEKSVIAATSAMTLGISAVLDYAFSKGMGAAQRSSMEKEFFKSAPSIRGAFEKQYTTSFKVAMEQASEAMLLDVNLSVQKIDSEVE